MKVDFWPQEPSWKMHAKTPCCCHSPTLSACLSPSLIPAACAADNKGSSEAEVSLELSAVPTEGSSVIIIVMLRKEDFPEDSSVHQPITPVCAPTAYPTYIPCSAYCLEPSVWHFKDRILPVAQFLCVPVSSAALSSAQATSLNLICHMQSSRLRKHQ